MSQVFKMNLKVLYILEHNGITNSTYLARSKGPQQVTVIDIPNDNGSNTTRTGIILLETVLNEISLSSPELLNDKLGKDGYDYNLYYQDVCESNEPLVSLGLLSKIRQKSNKDDDDDDEESSIVSGKVCMNFAAMLRNSKKNQNVSPETLEVKLQFSKVVTEPMTKKPSMKPIRSTISKSTTTATTTTSNKRKTNSMPAPKAKRTQSLPIWDPKQKKANLPKNSIAHRIYLADRKIEPTTSSSLQNINEGISLEHDRFSQKSQLSEAVSKRFDFMLNKKKKQTATKVNESQSSEKASTRGPKAYRMNTTPVIPVAAFDDSVELEKQQNRKMSLGEVSFSPDDAFHGLLFNESIPKNINYNDDKENILPSHDINFPSSINFHDINDKGDMEWLNTFNPFGSPSLNHILQNQQVLKPLNTTPKDINSCNTISLEEEHQLKSLGTSDIERTSPIDAFSMTLIESSEDSNISSSKIYHDDFEKVSPKLNRSMSNLPSLTEVKLHNNDDEEEEEEEVDDIMSFKKERIMPSSPTTMFSEKESELNEDAAKQDDLFKSFGHHSSPTSHDSVDASPKHQITSI